jgi:DNA-directed RNA polymerase specialized sigma24 family protein
MDGESPVDQGSGRSFEEFFAASYGPLVGLLFAFLHDRAQARNVVQDAFASALLRWRVVRGYHDPEAWVRKVAFRRAVDHPRRNARQLRALAVERITAELGLPAGTGPGRGRPGGAGAGDRLRAARRPTPEGADRRRPLAGGLVGACPAAV